MNIPINLVFEDSISEFTMLKLLASFGKKFYIGFSYPGNGFGYIKANINGFNRAASSTPFFVLTDLDEYDCPVSLINDWLKMPKNRNLVFRIAVREVEAWLLADSEGFSKFTGLPKANLNVDFEKEQDPKHSLIEIVKQSRKRELREDIIPINSNAKIGPNYNERLMEYVSEYWSISRAIGSSNSLKKAYDSLSDFTYRIS
jgi:hypothetical protein